MALRAPAVEKVLTVAVAGNPNAGKTTIFNRLTGLRQKVGNYPGVTVEKKTGACRIDGREVEVLDLPGAYSLTAQSPDEQIARDVLLGWRAETAPPDAVIVVVDATNLERNLFLATQIIELGYPTVVALNMVDLVEDFGASIDIDRLSHRLGVPVVPTVAHLGTGLDTLKASIIEAQPSRVRTPLAEPLQQAADQVADALVERHDALREHAPGMALRLITSPDGTDEAHQRWGKEAVDLVETARRTMLAEGLPWQGCEATSRYPWLRQLVGEVTAGMPPSTNVTRSDRIDRILTHRVWGLVIFVLAMAVVFQSIFTWAQPFMNLIGNGVGALGNAVRATLPAGVMTDLLVDGVIAGVGAVVVFIPQIVCLFFFLALLEESGYMARAAFVMDRIMSRVGLHGRSFVPLLSSYACAIPGIMAARTIASRRDRITTILVAPLMTCSARLPVYAVLIAAFVPRHKVLGGALSLQGLVLLGLYLLGTVSALLMASILKRTILRGPTPALLIELPPYRRPKAADVARTLWERAFVFVRFAGTVICSLSIMLWALSAYPQADTSQAPGLARAELMAQGVKPEGPALAAAVDRVQGRLQLEQSLLGRLGRGIEPVVRPLGFDWRIGVGLVAAFAAREVMVSTLSILYSVGSDDENNASLVDKLRQAERTDGTKLFTPAVVASLLIFFVFACQCISTIGVVVRETGGWRWAVFMELYMTGLAYVMSLLTFHGLRALGWG
ncbi:MAG: ferrous iron transport protein B [Armatimonadetes bacterium]|nr:ferrous iron transport protein B [Armatimonadota bacterium]